MLLYRILLNWCSNYNSTRNSQVLVEIISLIVRPFFLFVIFQSLVRSGPSFNSFCFSSTLVAWLSGLFSNVVVVLFGWEILLLDLARFCMHVSPWLSSSLMFPSFSLGYVCHYIVYHLSVPPVFSSFFSKSLSLFSTKDCLFSPSIEWKASNLQLVLLSFVLSRYTRRVSRVTVLPTITVLNTTKYLLFWYVARLQNEIRYAVAKKLRKWCTQKNRLFVIYNALCMLLKEK